MNQVAIGLLIVQILALYYHATFLFCVGLMGVVNNYKNLVEYYKKLMLILDNIYNYNNLNVLN